MSTLDDLQERLDLGRERLLETIELLPDDALLQPETIGRFSAADILAHLAVWEAEMVTGLMRLKQNKKPDQLLQAMKDPKTYSVRRHIENQHRDLDAIFDDFQGARMQLQRWLEEFSERDLTSPNRFRWLEGRSLAEVVAETSCEKESLYLQQLQSFAQVWLAQNEGQQPTG